MLNEFNNTITVMLVFYVAFLSFKLLRANYLNKKEIKINLANISKSNIEKLDEIKKDCIKKIDCKVDDSFEVLVKEMNKLSDHFNKNIDEKIEGLIKEEKSKKINS